MRSLIARLRAADPAAALPQRPDERAEADLRALLAEPMPVPMPVPVPEPDEAWSPPVREPRRLAPVLVTVAAAVAVVLGTAAVLAGAGQRQDAAAPAPTSSASSAPGLRPPYIPDDCHPAAVAPFQCGTYRSEYGAPSITGSTGGPAEDPLTISFSTVRTALLLTARSDDGCFAASIPVVHDGTRLVRAGEALFGVSERCPGGMRTGTWGERFLRGPLAIDGGGDGLAFDVSTAMVTFEYQGAAAMGEPQLPRNDARCIPAHVTPFGCARFRSTSGTGALAFLGEHPFRLSFQHVNGQLTGSLAGGCNGTAVVFQPDDHVIFAAPGGSTLMACSADRSARDRAVSDFFRGELTVAITDRTIVFTSGASSATFTTG